MCVREINEGSEKFLARPTSQNLIPLFIYFERLPGRTENFSPRPRLSNFTIFLHESD